jgi:hypothetical protein
VCLVLAVACVAASCSTSAPPPAPPPPAPPPPGAPSLDGWKLTLPTANERGEAASVDPARVTPPFLTRDAAGSLVFWAPVAGATTRNSDHARTELTGLTTFAAGGGRHTLNASVTVHQVPADTRDVIIAQVHGADELRAVPFVMLHWLDGALKVVVKQERSGSAARSYPLTGAVPLGARFDIGIADNGDGTLTFTANHAGDAPEATAPLPAAFSGATVRFQAGAYQQSVSVGTTAPPDDGARVTFSALTVSSGGPPPRGG